MRARGEGRSGDGVGLGPKPAAYSGIRLWIRHLGGVERRVWVLDVTRPRLRAQPLVTLPPHVTSRLLPIGPRTRRRVWVGRGGRAWGHVSRRPAALLAALATLGLMGCRTTDVTGPAAPDTPTPSAAPSATLAAAPGAPRPTQTTPGSSGAAAWRTLTPAERRVIVGKGTEAPFSGALYDQHDAGVYRCKRCGAALFSSDTKFSSGTGWPSFDKALPGAVREVPDADGERVEIVCARCGAHLGHVFRGEHLTPRSTRHCVNSIALTFQSAPPAATSPRQPSPRRARAYFAGGCFWGVEALFEDRPGVLDAVSGYMGGRGPAPSYREVSTGTTGYAETVEVVYDPAVTSYEALARWFFTIHDPTQRGRQGPDVGSQYRSAVFVTDERQRQVVTHLLELLRRRGYRVVTRVEPAGRFWPAEAYHQDHYRRTGGQPYCHAPVDRFGDL